MIPIDDSLALDDREIRFSTTRSPGPGGQHVNKVATRVTLTFDVANSPSLSDAQRARIRSVLATRVNKVGVMRVVCSLHRSQTANRREVLRRFTGLLSDALRQRAPRRKTRPTRSSVERRLAEKARRGLRKRERGLRPGRGEDHA